jgi:hypothetical protein
MQNPIDQVREGPRLNPMGTFTVRRKAAKRSERWRQNDTAVLPQSPQGEVILSRKKPRLDEPLPTTPDNATRENASPRILVAFVPPPADNDDSNAGPVTDTQPNACVAATGRWAAEEDAALTNAIAKTEKKRWGEEYKIDWVAIAALVPDRTKKQCWQRWHDALGPSIERSMPRRTGRFTKDEDLNLQGAVQLHGAKEWARIAVMVPTRTKIQCRDRWKNVLDPSIIDRANGRMGRWTEDEDLKLKHAVQTRGARDWPGIALMVPGRTNDQCLNRWRNALDPSTDWANGRTGSWTEEEDLKLKTSVEMHDGKDWAAIAVLVPDRTSKQCRQRWRNLR